MSQAMAVACTPYESHVRIAFARPPVNAFTTDMFGELLAVLDDLAQAPRPVLLVGEGGLFSAGYDIKQTADVAAATEEASRCLGAIQAHPAPVIAAVEGAAVGLGMLMAMSADILVVARSTRMGMPEVRLGIRSDVAPLRRYLTEPWVRRVCLLGDIFSAEDLHLDSAGAIVCDPGAAEDTATALAGALTEISTESLARTKQELAR